MRNTSVRPWIVTDLDGTLADDVPIQPTIDLVNTIGELARVEIWTGLSDMVLAETVRWLAKHGVRYDLLMRPAGDRRPPNKGKWVSQGIPCYHMQVPDNGRREPVPAGRGSA